MIARRDFLSRVVALLAAALAGLRAKPESVVFRKTQNAGKTTDHVVRDFVFQGFERVPRKFGRGRWRFSHDGTRWTAWEVRGES